jgi:hypothetical protein
MEKYVLQAGRGSLLVAEELVELDDELVLLLGEVAALEVRAQVVDPPQPAALPAPQQPCTAQPPVRPP